MSVCKIENGQKRRHRYSDTNKCDRCGHVTTHGANYRRVHSGDGSPLRKPIPVVMGNHRQSFPTTEDK